MKSKSHLCFRRLPLYPVSKATFFCLLPYLILHTTAGFGTTTFHMLKVEVFYFPALTLAGDNSMLAFRFSLTQDGETSKNLTGMIFFHNTPDVGVYCKTMVVIVKTDLKIKNQSPLIRS